MSTETVLVLLTLLLSYIHFSIPTFFRIRQHGLQNYLGTRDDSERVDNLFGQRADRANRNFHETLPWALVLLVLVQVTGDTNAATAAAGWVYLAARVLYLPLYIAGVPVLRTLMWLTSLGALVVMALQLVV